MSHSAVARRSVPIAIVVLLLTSAVPAAYSQWVGWFGELAMVIVTPVSHPASMVSRWLAPATRAPAPPEDVAALEAELARFRSLSLRLQRENETLWARIRDLQNNRDLAPDAPVSMMSAAVVGDSPDLSGVIRLRAGSQQGVVPNTVVAVGGMQLFGRVVQVANTWCDARPITDKEAGAVHSVIVVGDDVEAPKLLCRLVPQGDGTLKGPVEYERAPDSATPILAEAGQTAYLSDDTWPKSSQMLVVGRVRSVQTDPNNAQRQIVVVAPEVRLSRVTEVVLRMSAEGE